jgi:antitoxin component YwqK of YwqJK toxin-antitoxin module
MIIKTHPTGQIFKVRFFEEDVAVKEISYYENGQICEEVDLMEVDHKPVFHGVRVQIDREGNLYSVYNYHEGKAHGKMRVLFPSGALRFEGEFKNGLEEGPFTQYFEDGSKLEETGFVSGKKEGESIQYYPSGRKAKVTLWKDGKREGKETSWYENGVRAPIRRS